jgi:hypothetical protein
MSWIVVSATEPTQAARFVYREDLTRLVGFHTKEGLLIGRLDPKGDFVRLPGDRAVVVGNSADLEVEEINVPRVRGEIVFEFRSGSLIKGRFDSAGSFVPLIGSTVVDFKEYRYSKDSPRIYNLPGRFVEKKGEKK